MSFLGRKSKDKKKAERELMEKLGVDQKTFEEIQRSFRTLDQDNSGSISHAEFKAAMANQTCRSSDHEINEMIRSADHDNSGAIEFEEFAELMAVKCQENAALNKEIRDSFHRMDTNKDGKICMKELQRGLEAMGEGRLPDADVADIIRSADRDGDGVLGFEEFRQYIMDNQ